ncbi:MAG: phenylalanyl-tRNA synthetase, beta subunit [Rickettsiaceae bacterium]|jgi:phenylalanyl-tRNA synthetase beta chain|nr:phenylalanyl-tRNA synthetase, beta subunit [Rickettsiaceae bacterium]
MKFTLNWLKQYLETTATLEQIVEKLTALGLEVEGVVDNAATLAPFQIAQILEAVPHPDADKLRVCQVQTGQGQLQIVCGAANARAGINVVLAPVGSVIPTNGMVIKASKIRGVESNGMLCSAEELGLDETSDGIIEMAAENDNIAKKYVDIAGLNDPMIEIAITPNRGDCLGVYGIARDLAAAGLGKLKPLPTTKIAGKFKSPINVKIENEKECPMFVGRYFKNVKNGESPQWLKKRLTAIGLKPISTLVDITNYINFEFGRPLHVYDAKKLNGDLIVRSSKAGEKLKALNDSEYALDDNMTVIADSKSAQALGGIIGGAQSGCEDNTTDVFLEIALFNSDSVAKTGRKLDIITDSRYRFERNVDPLFVLPAAEIASRMILELCGGEASELVIAGSEPEWQREIDFDFAFVKQRGGIDISEAEGKKILESLGFKVSGKKVSVPSYRPDVEGKCDLVEEIIRVYGYDKLPMLDLPETGDKFESVLSPAQKRVSAVRRKLAASGMVEAITWSFMKDTTAKLFGGNKAELKLQNPISQDLSTMRPSILPNLIEALGRNSDRGYDNLALFEIGLVFEDTTPLGQKQIATGVRSGKAQEKDIYGAGRDVDAFDAKADCFTALEAAGAPVANLRVTTDAPSWYHPGRSGVLRLGKAAVAVFGEIHPGILKQLDVKGPVVAFEIFFGEIPAAKAKKTKAKSKLTASEYQSSKRDFAFIIDASVAAEEILRSVGGVDKNLIEEVKFFDVYQGKGIEEGKKSIAISIRIQAVDHTLTESELEGISKKVVEAVGKLGGVLRG